MVVGVGSLCEGSVKWVLKLDSRRGEKKHVRKGDRRAGKKVPEAVDSPPAEGIIPILGWLTVSMVKGCSTMLYKMVWWSGGWAS